MKSTKIMLAVIATFIVTWLTLSLLFYILSDMTYKESCTYSATGFMMLFIGWLPALIVGTDLDEKLKNC
jgi:uncharacterized membrane protein